MGFIATSHSHNTLHFLALFWPSLFPEISTRKLYRLRNQKFYMWPSLSELCPKFVIRAYFPWIFADFAKTKDQNSDPPREYRGPPVFHHSNKMVISYRMWLHFSDERNIAPAPVKKRGSVSSRMSTKDSRSSVSPTIKYLFTEERKKVGLKPSCHIPFTHAFSALRLVFEVIKFLSIDINEPT